nr:hypothetical protein [Tanacetum cinerariifolium]
MDPNKFEVPEEAPQSPEQAPPSPDYMPGLEYPEYVALSDDEIPLKNQPLPDPKEDPADYFDEEEEEEESSEDDEDEKEEEHLSLANFTLPAIDSVPSA